MDIPENPPDSGFWRRNLEGWARALFDGIDDAVFVHDLKGRILDVNAAACRRLGYSREELLRLNTSAIDDSEFAPGFGERLQQQLLEGHLRCEGRHRTKDGRLIFVDINSSLIDFRGKPCILSVTRNVTDQKRAERNRAIQFGIALEMIGARSLENLEPVLLRTIVEGMAWDLALMWILEESSPTLGFGGMWCRPELKFDHLAADLASFRIERGSGLAGRVWELGEPAWVAELRAEPLPESVGREFEQAGLLRAFAFPIWSSGTVTGVVATYSRKAEPPDQPLLLLATNLGSQIGQLLERHRVERALAASEKRYRQLTEATQDAIIVADRHGNITLFNPAAEKLFGYEPHEVLGQPISLLMPEDYRERHRLGMRRYLETHVPRVIGKPVELEGQRKDGTRFPLELVLSQLELASGDGSEVRFLGAIRDQTERNRMRSVLLQNEKLASIGLLSAGVAHEINNPIAFVGNNLAVLQRDLAGVMEILELYEQAHDPIRQANPDLAARIDDLTESIDLPYIRDNLDRLIGRTRDGVERVARIVGSLRGLARTGKPQRQAASIQDLIESALEIVRNRLRRLNIQAETKYDPNSTLTCVTDQLSQVFLNLLINATQAIEAMHRTEDNWIKVQVRRLEDDMLIQVADNGCGIPAENLPRIFDPFFTTKDVGEGTGLGLSITHNIIAAHGGRIEVNSTVGQGTVFRILLPLHPV